MPDRLLAIVSAHAAAGTCREVGCPWCAAAHRRVGRILELITATYGQDPQLRQLTSERYPTAA